MAFDLVCQGAQDVAVLEPGTYPAEIIMVEAVLSKGNAKVPPGCDQLNVKARIFGDSGAVAICTDFLTNHESVQWKIELFAKSVGIYPGDGQHLSLTPEKLNGLRGCVKVGYQRKQNAEGVWEPNPQYNQIEKWVLPDTAAAATPKQSAPATAPAPAPTPPPAAASHLEPPKTNTDDADDLVF